MASSATSARERGRAGPATTRRVRELVRAPGQAHRSPEEQQAQGQPDEPGDRGDEHLLRYERPRHLSRGHPDGTEHTEVTHALPRREEQRRDEVDEPDEQEQGIEAVDDRAENRLLARVVVHGVGTVGSRAVAVGECDLSGHGQWFKLVQS